MIFITDDGKMYKDNTLIRNGLHILARNIVEFDGVNLGQEQCHISSLEDGTTLISALIRKRASKPLYFDFIAYEYAVLPFFSGRAKFKPLRTNDDEEWGFVFAHNQSDNTLPILRYAIRPQGWKFLFIKIGSMFGLVAVSEDSPRHPKYYPVNNVYNDGKLCLGDNLGANIPTASALGALFNNPHNNDLAKSHETDFMPFFVSDDKRFDVVCTMPPTLDASGIFTSIAFSIQKEEKICVSKP